MAMAISAPLLPALRVPGMASRHPVVFRRLPPRTLVVAAPAPAPAPRRLAPSRPPRAGDMKETSQDELLARILHLPARVLSSASSASENYSRPFHLICVVTLAAIKSPKFPGAVASVAKKLKLSDDVVRQVVFIATCVKFLYDLCKSGKAVNRLVSYFLKSPKKIPPPPSPSDD